MTIEPKSSRSAFAAILLIVVLATLGVGVAVLVPDRVKEEVRNRNAREAERLDAIAQAYVDYAKANQTLPGAGTWLSAVSVQANLNESEVAQVYPAETGTNTARVLLIHPSFTPSSGADILPYTQAGTGLDPGSSDEPTADSRLLIVSNSRKEISLPHGSGVIAGPDFDAIWDWHYDKNAKLPPSGWPATWNGRADGLKVNRLNIKNLFHTYSLSNLSYAVNGGAINVATAGVSRILMSGTLVDLYSNTGPLHGKRLVLKDETIILPSEEEELEPIFYLTGDGIPSDPDGVPTAELSLTEPTLSSLPNYDPGRDSDAGLMVKKGGKNENESDSTKIQKWVTLAGDIDISGNVTLTFHSAMKDFADDKKGFLRFYLVDCNSSGTDCTKLTQVNVNNDPWSPSGGWIEYTVNFGSITHTVASDRRLGVAVIVQNSSGDDMWLAYGTTTYDGKLTLE